MARKSTKKKTTARKAKVAKHYPTVNSMQVTQVVGGTQARKLLQVDRCLSRINRRLYRMGRYYKVKLDLEVSSTDTYQVFALRDDWAVQKGFQMAYDQYLKNTADERNALGNMVARWEDFRVETGTSGTDELFPVLHTLSGSDTLLNAGSFDLANVVDASNTRRTFTWGGSGPTVYSILEEYDKSGNTQFSPSSSDVTGAPYGEIDTEVNDTTHVDLQLDGREPPYDQTGVNAGTPFVKICELGTTVPGVQKLSTGYFNAPCGIVLLLGVNGNVETEHLMLTVAPGEYKGVHAPSMLE